MAEPKLQLRKVLSNAGLDMPVAEAEDLLNGIAAAPRGRAPLDRLRLLAPDLGMEQAEMLDAFTEQAAAQYRGLKATGGEAAERLEALRAEISSCGLSGFIVPQGDEHQGEYVARRAQRLAWLTGFTGSAGTAIVLAGKATMFVDGRYTVQVAEQVDGALYDFEHLIKHPPADWLAENAGGGERIGHDPWLHTHNQVRRLTKACARAGAELVACPDNPLDAVWPGQPPAPLSPVIVHEESLAGESAAAKRTRLAEALAEKDIAGAVLTLPDSIAWLLNIRGGDLPHVPVSLAFAILHADGKVELFMDRRKLPPETLAHLGNGVAVAAPEAFGGALAALAEGGKRVQADPDSAAAWIFDQLKQGGAKLVRKRDPCVLPKALKNAVELEGTRSAHLTDGLALTRFLAWIAAHGTSGDIDEFAAAAKIDSLRGENPDLRDLSFGTISAAGPNAALPHYSATPESNRALEPGMLYLVDSGGQYPAGTTDCTRTVAIGTPGAEHRRHFTLVLKGHIALSSCRFPKGTGGGQLDVLARHALWQEGLDYDHGTGHGVGSYLSVHEGPHGISKRGNDVPLEPGMILSNEPGFYKAGEYGIRIENLIVVEPVEDGDGEHYTFRPLTCVPIDLNLVEAGRLTDQEKSWLNGYHVWVRETHLPRLEGPEAEWLKTATRALK